MAPNFKRFILLYGSETGQAQSIAEEIRDSAEQYQLKADTHCLSNVDKRFTLEQEEIAVFIVSTTGEGEPPETVLKFWKRLRKTTHSKTHLAHLKYCLLGLGDSNYNNFAKYGRDLDRRLQQLGAVRFMASAFADDALGLEKTVEPWIENLWPMLQTILKTEVDDKSNIQTFGEVKLKECFPIVHITMTDLSVSDHKELKELTSNESGLISDLSLRTAALYLPPLPLAYLDIMFHEEIIELTNHHFNENSEFPLSASNVKYVPIKSAAKLTTGDAVKTVLELTLDISDTTLKFEPGDCFSVLCQNDGIEVEDLLARLNLKDKADLKVQLSTKNDMKSNKKIMIPSHLAAQDLSLRRIFTYCCDIRSIPKKAFLRLLAEYTDNKEENRRLKELSSRQGSDHYTKFVREANISLFDILMAFPSCKPPIQRILEHLPRLQPRPYSVANSTELTPNLLKFVFTIVEIPKGNGRYCNRRGVCTGWLNKLTESKQNIDDQFSPKDFSQFSLSDPIKIPIFKRKSIGFHLPLDLSCPVIMIGAGAGVAPFIGFLEQRELSCKSESGGNWLIFGCRYKMKDFLYREKITKYYETGILERLSLAFSRQSETDDPKYVQHALKNSADTFIDWITKRRAILYVCGDAKNMAKDVRNAVQESLMSINGVTEHEAQEFIKEMQENKKYLQDIWT